MEPRFYGRLGYLPSMANAGGRTFPWALVAIPTLVVGYVLGMGLTRTCPMCTAIVDAFRPASATSRPAAVTEATPPAAVPSGPMHGAIFVGLDGKPMAVPDAAGKPMVIEIWATWCGPCRKQRELVHALSKEFGDRVAFVAASVDQAGPSAVRIYAAEHASPGSRVLDVMAGPAFLSAANRLAPQPSIPKIAYVDRKGNLVDVSVGGQSEAFMRAMLGNLLKD
jgi:thiol-disulfide isomerase/thioredoxin